MPRAVAAYTRDMARLHTDATRASEAMKALLGLAAARNLRMSRTKVAKLLYLADLRSVQHEGVAGSGVVWQWAHGRKEAILDLGEHRPIPDASATLARFQHMLDNHVADDTPAPRGCSEEILEPLSAARAQANKILLGD